MAVIVSLEPFSYYIKKTEHVDCNVIQWYFLESTTINDGIARRQNKYQHYQHPFASKLLVDVMG